MFEKLVESILVEYVSEWVVGLDAEKMKVALFGGKVEFRELQLKTSSLDKFELPVTVKAGTLGRLSLKVPWKRLMKEAVTIRIEDLYLLVVPAHEDERQAVTTAATASSSTAGMHDINDDSYALRMRWAKQQAVRVRELLEKNKNDDAANASAADSTSTGPNSGGDTTASWGYREKILHNILDNVSFEFVNIHIRYEDTTTLVAKNPLALGVTIDAITVSTTNANGHVTFIDRAQSHTPFVHKLLAVTRAGVYCDNTSSVANLTTTRRRAPLAATYILDPFNTSVTMTMNHDATTANAIPKLQFVADIGSIQASVTPDQCNDLLSVVNYVSTHELVLKRMHCRRHRPRVPVKHNAKQWWQYALVGVQVMYALPARHSALLSRTSTASGPTPTRASGGNSKVVRCDWTLFGVLYKCQSEYVHLHKRMLRAAAKKLPVETVVAERSRLNELEDVLDVDAIVFFRLCAAHELELEETRHDSTKKHSNWKARWHARTHSSGGSSDAADPLAGTRALDPSERLALYCSISERMHASSQALAAQALATKNSQAIQFAVDVAIASICVSLIEHGVYDSTSTTASTREFVQFELQQVAFAIFQRASSSSSSASIAAVHMRDFSQVVNAATGERLAQPLFYSLAAAAPQPKQQQQATPVDVSALTSTTDASSSGTVAAWPATAATAPALLPPPPRKRFVDVRIESSETTFKLDCMFEPFRYIHNLSVAAKLQTYFVAQVDVSPALKENAEDALAYSSEWLNHAVFAGPSALQTSVPSSATTTRTADSSTATSPSARVVELNIQLPEVDVLVLTTDTSPILQARLLSVDFGSGNLLDTFVFSLDGVTIIFYDGIVHGNSSVSSSSDGVDDTLTSKLLLRHQDALKDIRRAGVAAAADALQRRVQLSDYDLTKRTFSTILKKTRLVFNGAKVVTTSGRAPPRWTMQCTAPPIYFTLSSAQYRQVLQASASWGNSTLNVDATMVDDEASRDDDEDEPRTAAAVGDRSKISETTATAASADTKRVHRSTSSFAVREFDSRDERFGLSVVIPQIVIVLEGEESDQTAVTSSNDDSKPDDPTATAAAAATNSASPELAIDLVVDIRQVTVEAKFSSVAQTTAIDIRSLVVSKRQKTVATDGKKLKVTTAEAIAQVNEASGRTRHGDSDDDDAREPDPAYDPLTGEPTCKLLEVGPKASFVLVSAEPFRAKIRAQRVVLYWDQDLLVALFRSYLLGNSGAGSCSAASSRSSSRSSSGSTGAAATAQARDSPTADRLRVNRSTGTTASASASRNADDAVGRFGIDLHIARWYVFCRPQHTQSRNFALRLHGRALFGDISTIRTPHVVVKIHAKSGVTLESSRLLTPGVAAAAATFESPPAPATVLEEDVCELLSVTEPLTVTVESAGYGTLPHRTNAATYVHIHGAGVELNYVSAHVLVVAGYMQHELLSFFNWVSVQTQPQGVAVLDERTKIDADVTRVKVLLPRGAIGNARARERKPERVELDVERVTITSRPHPACPRMEQLRIEVSGAHISTCMVETELRQHTDAVASAEEAEASGAAKAHQQALDRALAVSKTRMFAHSAVFIEYSALPIVESERKRQRRREREARAGAAARKVKGFKDMDDVAREMEKLCAFVRVSLDRPADWEPQSRHDRSSGSSGSSFGHSEAHTTQAHAGAAIDLALDFQQLEIFACILNENFAECELQPRRPHDTSAAAIDDEFCALDVQVVIGEVHVNMLASNRVEDYQRKTALTPDERALARVVLQGVRVLISGYSSERAQYRVVATHASFWNVNTPADVCNDEDSDDSDDGNAASCTTATPLSAKRVLTLCAELYAASTQSQSPSTSTDSTEEAPCIDVTIDQHEPPADATAPKLPQDIRVHVETCALTPSIVHFASRIAPFLLQRAALPHYAPPPAGPVNVSVTTGVVHCMLAKHVPPSSADRSVSEPDDSERDDSFALHLILSGCFVVRYSNADAGLQHVQLFGRKLSAEVAAQWPPHDTSGDNDAAAATDATLSSSPTTSTLTPTLQRVSTASRSLSSAAADTLLLADYRRVLCDDFAVDMDVLDTVATEGVLRISASLAHFHAVLCTFDVFMFTQIAAFDFEDSRRPSYASTPDTCGDRNSSSGVLAAIDTNSSSRCTTEILVSTTLEDASVTFVREIGEYFTPVARVYTFCAMCKVRVVVPAKASAAAEPGSIASTTFVSPTASESSLRTASKTTATVTTCDIASNVVEITLAFSEESTSELRDDEGLSVWGFNTLLGSWEPIIEPWTFTLAVTLLDDRAGKVVTSIDLSGSSVHALSVNASPSLLDSLCTIAKELEPLISGSSATVRVSSARVISCGFYLANDCGVALSYWVSDSGAAAHTSRGYSYAPRQKRAPELLLPRHKVPLKLSTALFHSLAADQTVSFRWGDVGSIDSSTDSWHPLTDVRIHSAGKYVYSVLPKTRAVTSTSTTSATQPAQPPVLLALFDISSVFGYRTLTVSSLVRVFNDTDVAVDCGILAADGRSVIDVGTIEPHDACGIPITLVPSIAAVRVVVKPHQSSTVAIAATETGTAPAGAVTPDALDHRWSNELFISEKEDCTEHFAACSRVLADYDCRCQRMFDGAQPLHVSQICRANGRFFRVWTRVFAASNASSLRYAQLRVLPPLSFENKCGVALFVVVFVFKKVRRVAGAGASVSTGSNSAGTATHDREYFHLVASEKIAPRSTMQFFASSLHESTYCAISITGFSWSKLFLLPTVFPQSTTVGASSSSSNDGSVNARTSGSTSASTGSKGSVAAAFAGAMGSVAAAAATASSPSSLPGSPPTSSRTSAGVADVLCSLADFRARQATITVAFVSASQELNAMRKVILQPRFVLHNDTPLPLRFEPRAKVKSTISTAKAFFSIPSSATKKPALTCCGSPQLELIHSKLNALNGATTTSASPTAARSTVFKRSYSSAAAAAGSPRAGASPLTPTAPTSTQEEMEYFYCSESSVVSIQLEGNAAPTSGVQQFRLDAAMGGANSSLRVFDESKRRWFDLVALLEQVDSYTTKVTFVERYLVLNRTPHALECLPACDLAVRASNAQSAKTSSSASPSRSPAASASSSGPSISSSSDTDAATLQPSATTSFNWALRSTIPTDACVRLRIRQDSGDSSVAAAWLWSGKLSLHDVSETALKLSNKFTNCVHVVRVEVRVEAAVRVYVVLTSEDTAQFPLYRIINSTRNEAIHVKQSFDGASSELADSGSATGAAAYSRGVTQRVLPGESMCFGWDEAYFLQSLDRVLAIVYASDVAGSNGGTKVLLDQPGEAQRIELPATKSRPASHVYVHWYLNGVTKTVHLHDTELPRDKLTGKQNAPPQSVAASRIDSAVANSSGGSVGGGMIQRAVTRVSELNLAVRLPSILVSMLNSTPEEVLLLSAEKLELAYAQTVNEHDQCELKIGSFQLDNQLANAVFPVVFTPVPSNAFATIGFLDGSRNKAARPMTPPTLQERKRSNTVESSSENASGTDGSDTSNDDDTFFHVSIFRLCYGDDVEYIKYLSAMLQPARLQIDDFLIISVATLFTDCMQVVLHHYPSLPAAGLAASDSEATGGTSENSGSSSTVTTDASIAKIPPSERRMYIETLQLHPMKLHLTFQQNNLSTVTFFDDRATLLLPVVFMVLKSNLVNIDSAALTLNALHIDHSFTTRAFMASTVQQHYAFQGVLQIYALVGAADILGNPIGLVTNLGTGVKDFFYEPAAGMVKSPQEFVYGLSRGTASLVKNSVYGTFNAASKLTGTLSSGIAALSMDAKYINERNTRIRHEVPTHLGTGLLYGTKQLGQGILAGVSGVITAPALGAYNHGLSGFVEGVGRGLIGVAVKPTAGILDLAARTTAGITATATVFDKKARNTRVRLPRMMHTRDKRLRVYSTDEALISQLLQRLPTRLLQNEHYEAHVFLPLSRAVVATSHQLLHVDFSSLAVAAAAAAVAIGPPAPRITWKCALTSLWGAQKTSRGVSIMIGTATNVQVSPAMTTLVTRSSMSTVLIPLRDTEAAFADRVVKCVADLVAQQRQRATPESESYAAPPPRNSIGLVLEPVRVANSGLVPTGYEGAGGQVVDVFVGSACFRAGVEVGDIVVGFGGKKFERGDHGSALRYQLSLMPKGATLELLVLRNGEVRTIRVATE